VTWLILTPPALLVVLGLAAFAVRGKPRAAEWTGSWAGCSAGLLGLGATIAALAVDAEWTLTLPWLPRLGGSFAVGLDPVTGLFLLPVYVMSAVSSLYGGGYLRHGLHGAPPGRAGASWLFHHLLTASMALVLLARNAVLFLAAWETMTLVSWYLVTLEDSEAINRSAGITYLVASQVGTGFLLAFFALLGSRTDPSLPGAALDFARFGGLTAAPAAAAFLLALVGFGTKAGIVPLHIWLPEAHPAAPSHVSALMSGVMIKMGIYGVVRTLLILGSPPAWWGWTLLLVGAVSGILGVLLALSQHDVKRLLAYHSVENIGIICLGLGLGVLGTSFGAPLVALLGYSGALLHVVNHALFKGLLFLGAGAVAASTGTRDIDRLGGVMRRMPVTGAAFLVGAAAICGLPPFNGFVSEFLVLAGGLRSILALGAAEALAGVITIAALGLVGGLAAACFAKAFGIIFLGEPRSPDAERASEPGRTMLAPMAALAVLCAAIGFLGPLAVRLAVRPAALLAGLDRYDAASLISPTGTSLGAASALAGAATAAVLLLAGFRALLLRRREVRKVVTWDCGYDKPTPRMQYSASSFAAPLLGMFRRLMAPGRTGRIDPGPFPGPSRFHTESRDLIEHRVLRPGFDTLGRLATRLRQLQHGRLRWYVLYIAAALIVLLVWKLG
jgi:hydrogenase-4 component B